MTVCCGELTLSLMPSSERADNAATEAAQGIDLPVIEYAQGADGLPIPVTAAADELPPLTGGNMVCLTGPCRHYVDAVIDPGDRLASEDDDSVRELARYCLLFRGAEGPEDLGEQQVFACSRYAPPWWSLSGRRRKREVARYLRWARLRAGRQTDMPYDQWSRR